MRVLIVGGYGVFGGRLARLLADEPRIRMIIAGRSLEKAKAFCADVLAGVACEPAAFDRRDAAASLAALSPDVVVDASGPFQAYGDRPYALIEACIETGVSYLDLADASEFVDGVTAFDEAARARGVFVLSGVSSFPVLTAAVTRSLAAGMDRIDAIDGGIAPSPYAGVGLNVIRAISDYAGKPVRLWRSGAPAEGKGLVETRRFLISPPGHAPLPEIRFSLVDVPDLRVLPRLWPGVQEVWMGAGPTPEILHRMLNGLAALASLRLLPALAPLAPLFHWAINTVRWGEHRGGMYVRVRGEAGGRPVERSWHMVAEGDDGPFIPSMAAEAILRRRLEGAAPAPGARAATEALELSDYERLFERRTIYTGRRESPIGGGDLPLYRRVLGEAFDRLPAPIRITHEGTARMAGTATVERGRGLLSRLVGQLIGFPKEAAAVPVEVEFAPIPDGELWRRRFGARRFSSTQTEGRGPWAGLIRERFGAVTVGLALIVSSDRLDLVVRRWSVLGLPLPRRLAPCGKAFEHVVDGRFAFDVEIGHPLTGLIVRYRGALAPVSEEGSNKGATKRDRIGDSV
jgi:hypothetical protein